MQRSSSFCPQCQLLVFRRGVGTDRHSDAPAEVVIGTARVSTDGSVARIVDAIPVLPELVEWLQRYWSKPMERTKLLGGGVRVGPNQLSHLHSVVKSHAVALDVDCPELFVTAKPDLNAYTFGTNDDACIVVHSALIELLDNQELDFILAHEMGHIKARHVTYASALAMVSRGLTGVLTVPLDLVKAPLDAWSRASEETADRIGVLLTEDPRAAIRALALLAVGSRKLLAQMDLLSYLEQHTDLTDFYGKLSLYFGGHDHPHTVTRVLNVIEFVNSDVFRRARGALRLPVTTCSTQLEAHHSRIIEGTVRESAGNDQFCPGCGFEREAGGSTVCVACGREF